VFASASRRIGARLAVAAGLVSAAGTAEAQGARRFENTPTLSAFATYDSNILSDPAASVSGAGLTAEGSLASRFRFSSRTALSSELSLAAEKLFDAGEFDAFPSRAAARLSLERRLSPRTTLTARGGWSYSQRAGELLVDTGLEPGRIEAHQLTGSLDLDRSIGPESDVGLEYRVRRLALEEREAGLSHSLEGHWRRPVSQKTALELRLGAQVDDVSPGAIGSATLTRTLQHVVLSLRYARRQTAFSTGEDGRVTTDTIGARLDYSRRGLFLSAEPSLHRNERDGEAFDAISVRIQASIRVRAGFTLGSYYRYSTQEARLADPSEPDSVERHVFGAGITLGGR